MEPPSVDLLYEQGACLCVHKPSGLLTQAPPGIDSMESRLTQFLKLREGKTGNIYLGVPHRLDRPVSGVMVFARNVRACRRLSDQFAGRIVLKVYWACVAGCVDPLEGTWIDHLRKVPDQPRGEIVPATEQDARQAVLHYRTLGQTSFGAWLEIELETGRMHQIRIQAAARGHPVLGDEMYGSQVPFGCLWQDRRLRPIALHARSMALLHPMTHEKIHVAAPLPASWHVLGPCFRVPSE